MDSDCLCVFFLACVTHHDLRDRSRNLSPFDKCSVRALFSFLRQLFYKLEKEARTLLLSSFHLFLLLIITSWDFYRTLYYFFIQFRILIDNRTFVYNESEKFIKDGIDRFNGS